VIGCGTRSQLPALIERLGHRSGVLVTDSFFVKHTPWVDEYLTASRALGTRTVVFDGCVPDPTTTLCDEATTEVRRALRGQPVDHVIALGGGSNIDLARPWPTLPGGRPVQASSWATSALPSLAADRVADDIGPVRKQHRVRSCSTQQRHQARGDQTATTGRVVIRTHVHLSAAMTADSGSTC
jgi:hypothetical protein